jgi:hypothetical protein
MEAYQRFGGALPHDYEFKYSDSDLIKPLFVSFEVRADPIAGLRLRLTTEALLPALWWAFVRKMTRDVRLRECLHCGAPIRIGPGTGMHGNARFCSDQHQSAYYQQKRSKGAGPRTCLYCHEEFQTGPGTDKRTDAKFCSVDHRIRFNSLQRRKG